MTLFFFLFFISLLFILLWFLLSLLARLQPLVPGQLEELDFDHTAEHDEDGSTDDFTIGEPFAVGQYTNLYRAVHNVHNLDLVLRVLEDNETTRQVVEYEQFNQHQFTHDVFLKFFAFFYDKDHIFLCLEYPTNGAVSSQLDIMTEAKVKVITIDIVNALLDAHRRHVIHRKLSISKLFFGHNQKIQIADFGYCVGERVEEHDGDQDVADIVAITRVLLSKVQVLSVEASHFLDHKHGSLDQVLMHNWIRI